MLGRALAPVVFAGVLAGCGLLTSGSNSPPDGPGADRDAAGDGGRAGPGGRGGVAGGGGAGAGGNAGVGGAAGSVPDGPGRWTPLPPTGGVGRSGHVAAFSGRDVVFWGGSRQLDSGVGYAPVAEPLVYDVGAERWRTGIPAALAPPRNFPTAVFIDRFILFWGGGTSSGYERTGALYNPTGETWVPFGAANAPAGRGSHGAVWTGSEVIVWGGRVGASAWTNDGARIGLDSIAWTTIAAAGLSERSSAATVWTGSEMIVWGGENGSGTRGDGARYDPVADRWTPMTGIGALAPRSDVAAAWIGREVVIWGGLGPGGRLFGDGATYDPVRDEWQPLPSTGAPSARAAPFFVRSGDDLFVFGGSGEIRRGLATSVGGGGRYRPAEGRWLPVAIEGAPAARGAIAGAAIDGGSVIVWGGFSGDGTSATYLADGARWDPTPP